MKILNFESGHTLTREEMKSIGGGIMRSGCRCSCDHHAGTWPEEQDANGECHDGNSIHCRDENDVSPGPYSCE